ncbi:MAG TPA: alpha/beta fold hydrolase [Aquabacterium sp.]|nr:alpha/beta fold hydrolase [Aquabacterium sp.]
MSLAGRPDAWIKSFRAGGERLRLFCFPYAGGGPQVFQTWGAWLPPRVGLHAVHLPGRGTRLNELPLHRLEPIVVAIVRALRPMQDLPFAFFGHSMGALLAFETTRALRLGSAGPSLLIASGCRAPPLIEEREKIHDLSDAAFIRKLVELGGTPEEVLEHRELLDLLLPTLRADFAVIDTYRYSPAALLACPVTVISGSTDAHASRSTMDAWQLQTSNRVSFREIEGGHFFVHSAEHELAKIVADELDRCMAPGVVSAW